MNINPHPTSDHGFAPELIAAALADALAHRRQGQPALLAISGLQGSGKSTFAAQVVALAQAQGLQAEALSIDDVYLTAAERRHLAEHVHPLLGTRGPPGSHDLPLAHAVLDAVAAGKPLRLPRFDKLGDDRLPESQWSLVSQPLDLLVMEGWLLGTPAEADSALTTPLNDLERTEDPDGIWRGYCNQTLARDYPALWQRFDRLWLLKAPSFEIVSQWRGQQEQALLAAEPGRKGMDRQQLQRFLQHYERVSRQALRCLPTLAHQVLALDEQRHPTVLASQR